MLTTSNCLKFIYLFILTSIWDPRDAAGLLNQTKSNKNIILCARVTAREFAKID
ncbi:hypothetical protein HanPI659440_Chr01g0009931 [Helianthus annuus]|nr:hypothetical protein HanPI659440_Chr01g0009931 [Helianthus annuus]